MIKKTEHGYKVICDNKNCQQEKFVTLLDSPAINRCKKLLVNSGWVIISPTHTFCDQDCYVDFCKDPESIVNDLERFY